MMSDNTVEWITPSGKWHRLDGWRAIAFVYCFLTAIFFAGVVVGLGIGALAP